MKAKQSALTISLSSALQGAMYYFSAISDKILFSPRISCYSGILQEGTVLNFFDQWIFDSFMQRAINFRVLTPSLIKWVSPACGNYISFESSPQGARRDLIRALSSMLPWDVICPGHWCACASLLWGKEKSSFQRLLIMHLTQEI